MSNADRAGGVWSVARWNAVPAWNAGSSEDIDGPAPCDWKRRGQERKDVRRPEPFSGQRVERGDAATSIEREDRAALVGQRHEVAGRYRTPDQLAGFEVQCANVRLWFG